MMPPARGLLNALSSVFLTTPRRVPMTMNLSLSNSFTASSAAIRSPSSIDTEVGDRLAAAVRTDVGNLVHLQPVGAAAVREDHDVGVRRRDEEVADEVLLARPHADAALAAAPLVPVVRDRGALDVAGVADRDRHVLFGDQVLDAELAFLGEDLGAARRRRTCRGPVAQLVDDDLHQQLVARRGSPAAARSASAARRARRESSAARGRSGAAAACREWPAPGSG